MWSQWDSRSGGSDNDLPPSSPVCACKRDGERKTEIVSQCMYSKCVCVWKCFCGCNDADGHYVVQTDNESCDSTITGHYRNIKPNLSFLCPTTALIFTLTYRSIFVHQNPNYLHSHRDTPLHLNQIIMSNAHTKNTATTIYQPIQPFMHSETPSYLQTPSQWPRYECCDDLLNGKWYHTA